MREDETNVRAGAVYLTAFLEGLIVIVVEIAGARALAPFYGTSLQVWTAQITMTLFFLALGYGLGGFIARHARARVVAALFGVAGAWVVLYPFLRGAELERTQLLGVALGSLAGAAILFGVPLMMLGAVSPVLVAVLDERRRGAGSAAGRLFFTNTMGGLVGGWLTAFLIVPHSSLRHSLVSSGLVLLVIAMGWALSRRRKRAAVLVGIVLVGGVAVRLLHHPPREMTSKYGEPIKVLYSKQSAIGLLQVIDFPSERMQLTNGVIQGAMNLQTRRTDHDYLDNLHALSFMHHPDAKTAVVLGLGPGLLAKELALRGVETTAVELEPRVVELAREYFELPDSIKVATEDARTFLRRRDEKFDLIFLDTYAGESTAWYLLTVEALREMKARLSPGGKVLINNASWTRRKSEGIERIEATALAVFKAAMIYPDPPSGDDPDQIGNTCIVVGDELSPRQILPATMTDQADLPGKLMAVQRAARSLDAKFVMTDDRSDLDAVESTLRIHWRVLIWQWMRSSQLWD